MGAAPRCGRFLSEIRVRHGLSQTELAERVGMPQANISRLERDTGSPTVKTLNRLLEAMDQTLQVTAVPLDRPPPRGGNLSVAELRTAYDDTRPGSRVEQAAILSNVASELAASRPGR